MSILRNFNWEHEIVFEDGSYTHLFIENPITLRKYILELLAQTNGIEGDFVLSKDNVEIPISKNLAIITDPINLQFDEKKINTRINKDIVSLIKDPELQQDSYPLLSLIEQFASKITEEYKFSIDYDIPEDSSIVKMLNFHIDTDYESPAEKLIEWVNISHEILGIENFILLNTSTFFTKEELETLTAELSAAKHNILFIDQFNLYGFSHSITIDPDNCELF